MFTGIIETLGLIKKINQNEIFVNISIDEIKAGDSISVNGICLTVKELKKISKGYECRFDISSETYARTNLKFLKINELVNIERSIKIGSRLDGHIVTGHIDNISKILSIKKGDGYEFEFSIPEKLDQFIAEKGSIALDGISLTVAKKMKNKFSVAIVPFTFNNTNLKSRKVGDYVNLEVDILARYVHSILENETSNLKLKEIFGVDL